MPTHTLPALQKDIIGPCQLISATVYVSHWSDLAAASPLFGFCLPVFARASIYRLYRHLHTCDVCSSEWPVHLLMFREEG